MKNKKRGIINLCLVLVAIAVLSFTTLVGIGVQHKGSAKNIRLGLDLAGGVSVTYETEKDNPTAQQISDTIYKLQKRVEGYSTESAVYKEGSNRINVDIPGVTDANEILEALGKAGDIEFQTEDGTTVIDGSDISTAEADVQQDSTTGQKNYVVKLTLNTDGTEKFAEATQDNIGKAISIVYDGETLQSPTVESAITNGEAVIEGQQSYEAAENLASTIRIGALPLKLNEIRSNVVGAKLGEKALNTSLIAGLIGFILILLFMIAYYKLPGVAASIALCLYVVTVLVTINAFDVTLTLPGVAGILLSIGMAVDANVIIFTRIREELEVGKTVRQGIKAGFDKAFSAIFDGNITTLIAAGVLYFKGSGSVKGFAETLAIGIVISMITALLITKAILNSFYAFGCDDKKYFGREKKTFNFKYTKHKMKYYVISSIVILIGIGALFVYKSSTGSILNYDLDFKGGSQTEITFNDSNIPDNAELEKVIQDATGAKVEISAIQDKNAVLAKTETLSLEQRTELSSALDEEYGIKEKNISTESISASVSSEMKRDAVVAVIIATICMLIYIWIRFKDFAFGGSAVIALLHDVLVVFMVYSVFRIPVGGTFIACMLTILGYSINATIVIFDRIRENKVGAKNIEQIEQIVNESINQTFTRSLNTSLTTFVMVFILGIMGVSAIKEFAIPLMAGIICGCYSSVCITGTVWYSFKKLTAKKKA